MDEILSSSKLGNSSVGSAFRDRTHFIFIGHSFFASLKKSSDAEACLDAWEDDLIQSMTLMMPSIWAHGLWHNDPR